MSQPQGLLGTESDRSFLATLVSHVRARRTFRELTISLSYARDSRYQAVEDILFNPALEAALERFEYFSCLNIRSRSNRVSFDRTLRSNPGHWTDRQIKWHPDVMTRLPSLQKKITPPGCVLANCRKLETKDTDDGQLLYVQCHDWILVFHPETHEVCDYPSVCDGADRCMASIQYLQTFHLTNSCRLIHHASRMVYLSSGGLVYNVLVLVFDHCGEHVFSILWLLRLINVLNMCVITIQ